MLSTFILPFAVAAGALAAPPTPPTLAALRDAPTAVDRFKLLDQDEFFKFDFNTPPGTVGAGGRTVGATVSNWPALEKTGISMTIGFLGPCGMNTPHTHPRAAEILFVTNGTVKSGLVAENGGRFVFNELQAGQAMIFPQGYIHFQQNTGCDNITFVAALSSEDPGVNSISQRFFGLPGGTISAALDFGLSRDQLVDLGSRIPDNVALGDEECLKKCGIDPAHVSQPSKQIQERKPGAKNGFEVGFADYWPNGSKPASPKVAGAFATGEDGENGGSDMKALLKQPLTIGLLAAVGALVLGYIVLGVVYALRRKNASRQARWYSPDGASRSLVSQSETDKYDAPTRYDIPAHTQ